MKFNIYRKWRKVHCFSYRECQELVDTINFIREELNNG